MADAVDVDQIGMMPRLVADDAAARGAGNVDGEGEPVADRLARRGRPRRRLDQADLLVQAPCR
jgi:hypothetical protein